MFSLYVRNTEHSVTSVTSTNSYRLFYFVVVVGYHMDQK